MSATTLPQRPTRPWDESKVRREGDGRFGSKGSSTTTERPKRPASQKKHARPKRPGGEKRGNSRDRRRRKEWMLETWGDGTTCPCVHCEAPLVYETVEADRIVPGGSYRRENIQPSCRGCNAARSNDTEWDQANSASVAKKFEEHKVKRDERGRFARTARSGSTRNEHGMDTGDAHPNPRVRENAMDMLMDVLRPDEEREDYDPTDDLNDAMAEDDEYGDTGGVTNPNVSRIQPPPPLEETFSSENLSGDIDLGPEQARRVHLASIRQSGRRDIREFHAETGPPSRWQGVVSFTDSDTGEVNYHVRDVTGGTITMFDDKDEAEAFIEGASEEYETLVSELHRDPGDLGRRRLARFLGRANSGPSNGPASEWTARERNGLWVVVTGDGDELNAFGDYERAEAYIDGAMDAQASYTSPLVFHRPNAWEVYRDNITGRVRISDPAHNTHISSFDSQAEADAFMRSARTYAGLTTPTQRDPSDGVNTEAGGKKLFDPAKYDAPLDELDYSDPQEAEVLADRIFEMETENGTTFQVSTVRNTLYGIEARGEVRTSDGLAVGRWTRTLNIEEGEAHHDYFSIDREYQGEGLKRQWFDQLYDAYRELGIETVHVGAGLTVGGYAWAKEGFDWEEPPSSLGYTIDRTMRSVESRLEERVGTTKEAAETRLGRTLSWSEFHEQAMYGTLDPTGDAAVAAMHSEEFTLRDWRVIGGEDRDFQRIEKRWKDYLEATGVRSDMPMRWVDIDPEAGVVEYTTPAEEAREELHAEMDFVLGEGWRDRLVAEAEELSSLRENLRDNVLDGLHLIPFDSDSPALTWDLLEEAENMRDELRSGFIDAGDFAQWLNEPEYRWKDGKHTLWPGKKMLLGTSWSGVMYL